MHGSAGGWLAARGEWVGGYVVCFRTWFVLSFVEGCNLMNCNLSLDLI